MSCQGRQDQPAPTAGHIRVTHNTQTGIKLRKNLLSFGNNLYDEKATDGKPYEGRCNAIGLYILKMEEYTKHMKTEPRQVCMYEIGAEH